MMPFLVGVILALAVALFAKLVGGIVAGGLIAHGLFDFVHGRLIANPGIPEWWPAFCLSYYVTAGVCVAWMLHRGALRVSPDARRE